MRSKIQPKLQTEFATYYIKKDLWQNQANGGTIINLIRFESLVMLLKCL